MSLFAEFKQIMYDLPMAAQPDRNEVAHFCEHSGLSIQFTRARTVWHALAPSAIKPWWIILEPMRKPQRKQQKNNQQVQTKQNKKNVGVSKHA